MRIGTGTVVNDAGGDAALLAYVVWDPTEWLAMPRGTALGTTTRGRQTAIRRAQMIRGNDPDPAAFAVVLEQHARMLDAGERGLVVLSGHPFTKGYPTPPTWAVAMLATAGRGLWVAVDHVVVAAEIDSPVRPGTTVCSGKGWRYEPAR